MDFETARIKLIEHLAREIRDRRVLAAMARVPREFFVPPDYKLQAYQDRPLPISLDQTISQPYIVALMTQGLELDGSECVLEVGTGSGYQSAVLAELCRKVVTTERLPSLSRSAGEVLRRLGYDNIELHITEETLGWEDGAPYDAIMATAAAPSIPDELVRQLAINGRMVIPVGSRNLQELIKITRLAKRNITENLGACRFVSLIGKGAWSE
ncbi:MAG TPA: protein-L-isoaspartate(D-aspartate) O-methyltransferase [Dehalococcoidia bacterium]|nr:protein-L-isoaspartate(D-aspartate) O-methyltransferase [Dehalococcoidia bacterium]